MKHIRQRPNECWMTSVCMVTGYDIERLRTQLQERFGKPWNGSGVGGLWSDWRRSWAMNTKIRRFIVGITGAPESVFELGWLQLSTMSIPRGRGPKWTLPPGRGILRIINVSKRISHVIAFENGRVYDGELDYPITIDTYQKLRRGWRLDKAVVVEPQRKLQVPTGASST